MSHELRTPLNAIIGFSEVLQSELFGPLGAARYKDYADHIHSSGTHLLGLINDILDLSKLDAGKIVLELEEADLCALASETLHMLDSQAQKAAVRVTQSGEECLRLRMDVRRMRQILINLLSNAIKFTPEGGSVTVRIAEEDGVAVLAVIDTGIGMDADELPRALSRFGQIESGLSRKYQGTGLGLPLVKQLAEMHGGALVLDSTPGLGTTATVRLPIR
jgi:two-component system cell cycle sensor histidine kinase PleC